MSKLSSRCTGGAGVKPISKAIAILLESQWVSSINEMAHVKASEMDMRRRISI